MAGKMDGSTTDGWIDGCMDGWVDGYMDTWLNGCMDGWMDGCMEECAGGEDGWIVGWMDGWMDGWTDGWMNRWIDGSMDGWMDEEDEQRLGVLQQKMPSNDFATVTAERQAVEVNENCQVTKQHHSQLPAVCPRVSKTKHFERAPMSQPIRRCIHMCRSRCNFGPHELKSGVSKGPHDH